MDFPVHQTVEQAYRHAGVTQSSSTPQTSALQPIAKPRGYSTALRSAFSTPTRTSASSLHPSSAFSLRSVQSTHPSTLSNATTSSQPSVIDLGSPASSKTSDHLHWCNVCEHPKAIETCDGYKRHMREHETIYTCMPDGPVKPTEAGAECYFCGASNPNETHLATHEVSKCYGQSAKRYTRKINMHNHIRDIHKTSEDHASALAKAWVDPHTIKRKFFSCGFCICCFPTLVKKSNHIDLEHWRQHQELNAWDNDKVILGLLLQPGVKEEWHQRLMSAGIDPQFDPRFNPAPHWDPSVVEQVQLQLEIGEDPPASLAGLAFETSSYYSTYQNKVSNGNLTFQPCNGGVDISGYPSIEQNTIDTMQMPNQEFLQCSGDSSTNDSHLRASHWHRANSFHGDASYSAQILPEIEHRPEFKTELYENIVTNYEQQLGFNDHSNLFDTDPSGGASGSSFDLEAPSSSPWSAYTVSRRPGFTQDPTFTGVTSGTQVSFDPTLSAMHMDIASERSAGQPDIDLLQHDSPPRLNVSSSVDEATPYVSARRISSRPKVIGGSKRKLSDSPKPESRWNLEPNPIVIEKGRGSRGRHHEDHLRGKKRVEGYNG